MAILADARPYAHPTPTRRIVASYAGTVAGLRAALLTGAVLTPAAAGTPLSTAGGAR
ncbi:hypothetical protein [Micromonospora sp. NPDC023633]|uniref:hypothetical protein n=1 Tax=Micromonospora sp. NPDC023633 TaxID=3154320 RepID=UPI0033EDADE3